MKKLFCAVVVFLFFVGIIHVQEWEAESVYLHRMFIKMADGLVYCYSDRSKTTGVAVKRTKEGTWFVTAQHKVDRDFPQASTIYVKVDRKRETEIFESSKSVVSEDRELDLLIFFVPGLRMKYVFKNFRNPCRYEETWIFGFRGGAGKVPGAPGYVTDYFADRKFAYTTASIWYGNSGSPVISRHGDTVGVAVRMPNQSADGLFISGDVVKEFIEKALILQKK